jgi:hypothetical protein
MRTLLALALLGLALLAIPSSQAEPDAAGLVPCTIHQPSHAGFDCTVGPVHCAVRIWLDLNPPNPTWDCP